MELDVQVSISDSEVIASGTVVTSSKLGVNLKLNDLIMRLEFDDAPAKTSISDIIVNKKERRLILRGFDNPLGNSFDFTNIGSSGDEVLWMSLCVHSIGNTKIVSYTFAKGGSLND